MVGSRRERERERTRIDVKPLGKWKQAADSLMVRGDDKFRRSLPTISFVRSKTGRAVSLFQDLLRYQN
jgi:hypothetical protein